MTKQKFTPEGLIAHVENMEAQGLSRKEIAKRLGITRINLNVQLHNARKKLAAPPEIMEDDGPESEGLQIEGGDNRLEIEATRSRRIKTLDDLLEASQVDLTIWQVDRYVVNKWEVGIKDKQTQSVKVEPLWQVKAWLTRRKVGMIEHVLQPVEIIVEAERDGLRGPPNKEGKDKLHKALIIPDTQIGFRKDLHTGNLDPFHDRQAISLAIELARQGEWDAIVLLGDFLDLPDWSDKFLRSPEFYFSTQPAVIEGAWILAEIRQANPTAKIHYLEGNHELRLDRMIMGHLAHAYHLHPADEVRLAPVLSVERLLGLDGLNVEYIAGYPDAALYLNEGLAITHGQLARNVPGGSAGAAVDRLTTSVIFGHVHRIEQVTRTIRSAGGTRAITSSSPGCLCRLDGTVPGHTLRQDWAHGLAVAYYDPQSAWHSIQVLPIMDGWMVYDGKTITGADYRDKLVRDTGWRF